VGVILVDENRRLGGQYYRQAPAAPGASDAAGIGPEQAEGRRLVQEVRALGVEVRLETAAWGVFDGRTVALATHDRASRVRAEALVLAAGAHDRPVPFPGWTLPGVMTAGGALNLMKGDRVLPGRRVLVAGSGPLLLVVAHRLIREGAEIVAVCEAAALRGLWRLGLRLLPHLDMVQRGYRHRQALQQAGVPFLTGHVIRRALGTSAVEGAIVSRCDEDWVPLPRTERAFEVDTVVVGYGLVPSLALSRVAGCEHRYVPLVDAWAPVRSRDMESTVPGLFVVGDGAGPAGAAVALAEGRLAGLAVANRLGKLAGRAWTKERARARGRLRHLEGFRRVLDGLYRVGPGLHTLADDGTVLCRCEEVSAGETLAAIRDGATETNEVKAWTRVGMGRCQGRMCGPALAQMIARVTGRPVAEIGPLTARPPVTPVPLGVLAGE
jgi:NADPH-dependent 2,4-dienoyl-CoA reductase/sulfur reductase-like enzyme